MYFQFTLVYTIAIVKNYKITLFSYIICNHTTEHLNSLSDSYSPINKNSHSIFFSS